MSLPGTHGKTADPGSGISRSGSRHGKYHLRETDFTDEELRDWWLDSYRTGRLRRNTFFQSWEWNSAWYRHYVRSDSRRRLVLLRIDRVGSPVAAVPLYLQSRRFGPFAIWSHLCWIGERLGQYPDMVTTESDASTAWRQTLSYLCGQYPQSRLTLYDILPESTITPLLKQDVFSGEQSESAGIGSPFLPDVQPAHSVCLTERGEPYMRVDLHALDVHSWTDACAPHLSREIGRAARLRARDGGLRWNLHIAPDSAVVDRLIHLNRMRFGSRSWFAETGNIDFFRMLAAENERELLISEISRASTSLHLAACRLHGDTVHYLLSGMDPSAKRWSPGTMNLAALIEWSLGEGYRFFDFLRGDEHYKREYPVDIRSSMHLTVVPAGARRSDRLRRFLRAWREAGR
jgi:CelD/BcsL family acetyltransferase involved in cellulose biosynthesis